MKFLKPRRPARDATASIRSSRYYASSLIEVHQIAEALTSRGYSHIAAIQKLVPGASVRIASRGKLPTNKSVQVRLFADSRGAFVTDYATGEGFPIWPSVGQLINSKESSRLFREAEERRRQQEAERQELHELSAREAQARWCAGLVVDRHEYADRKQITQLHNVRVDTATGALMIPMWVSDVGLVNLQLIYPDGKKRFLANARVKGAYSVIGCLNNEQQVLVCEGWATGHSLYSLYGLSVVVAFNAGNLMPVCQALRSRFEELPVVVAGDDDRQSEVNVGRQRALEAAESIGAELLFPELCKACRCTDFNDKLVCMRRISHG